MDAATAILQHPARLSALSELGLLDTPPEPAFDRLTRLAARLLRTPIALIALIDDRRLFIKSGVGLPHDLLAARALAIDEPELVARALAGPLMISDARQTGERLPGALGARALASVPLTLSDGAAIGVLWVGDHQRRAWASADLGDLHDLGGSAITEIVLHRALASNQPPPGDASLIGAARQRIYEYAALYSASSAIASSLELPTILRQVVEQLCRAVDGTSAYLCSYDAARQEITVLSEYMAAEASERERSSDLGARYSLPRDFPNSLLTLRTGQPMLMRLSDMQLEPQQRAHMAEYGALTSLEIPLRVRGEVVAFAALWDSRRERSFSDRELMLCQTIAQYAGIAIQHGQLYAQAEASRQRYAALARSIPDTVVSLFDGGLRHVLVDGASPRLFEVDRDALVGRTLGEALPGDLAERLAPLYRSALAGAPAEADLERGGRHFSVRTLPVAEPAGEHPIGLAIVQDVSARKASEAEQLRMTEQLLEARSRESLAVLAGGIAHVFNNMLAVIMGYAELALLDVPGDAPLRDDLHTIIRTVGRATALTSQILTYTGRQGIVSQPTDLNLIVEGVPVLLGQVLPPLASIALDLAPDLPLIMADSTAIQQIIHQLLTNAAEAIGAQRGTVRIGTRARQVAAEDLAGMQRSPEVGAGYYVELSISDDGPGMDAATRQRIFEPFYTTKFPGRGLGLPATLGAVRSHGGAIGVTSAPGAGTRVEILFPAVRAEDMRADGPQQHEE